MQSVEPRASTLTAAAWHIGRVKSKLASGAYPTEATFCLCGHPDAVPVAERDRYGIPHTMVLCTGCGLIRANPRMTQAAYRTFYETEYRPIYDGWEFGPHPSDAVRFAVKGLDAESFREFLDFFDAKPELVFDFGCGGGELIECLRAAGMQCVGVDFFPTNGNGVAGGIEALEALGKKADLIVLQQVVEHLNEPLLDLQRLRALLAPNGLLFIGTPGLYMTRRHLLFQNAHVWQFTTDTLTYLMQRAEFEEMYLDERIWSLWRAADEPTPAPCPKEAGGMALRYLTTGERPLPLIKTINKFPMRARKENLASSLGRGFPDISALVDSEQGKSAVIIGGGPSIDDQIERIREIQAGGAIVVSIERMNLWCIAHAIRPDYVVTMDASGDVLEGLTRLDPQSKHLVATQCTPAVFDRLAEAGATVYVFNTPQRGIELGDLWNAGNYDRMTILNAGGSVTLGCMSAAMLLGMRDLHVFGFDCHVTGGSYADGIAGVGSIGQTIEVRVDDRVFRTTYSYVSFAQQFHLLHQLGVKLGRLDAMRIYGDSLAAFMSVEDIRGDHAH